MSATLISWLLARRDFRESERARFNLLAEQTREEINERLLDQAQVLQGARGLFAASISVDRGEWKAYVSHIDLKRYYPAIRSLAFLEFVPHSQRDAWLRGARTNDAVDFLIFPESDRTNHLIIKYIEPMEQNKTALGFDVLTEERRRQAAEWAVDTGTATVTRRVHLVQDPSAQVAAMMILPVYRTGAPIGTIEERRAAAQGVVVASFQMEDFMRGLLHTRERDFDFEIFDGMEMKRETLLHDEDGTLHLTEEGYEPHFSTTNTLAVGGHNWTLYYSTLKGFGGDFGQSLSPLILCGGLAMSLLVFGITRSLSTTRRRALAMAEEMTATLRLQERAMRCYHQGIFIADAQAEDRPVVYVNPAMERITGYSAEELLGQNIRRLLGEDQDQPELPKLRQAMAEGKDCHVILRNYRKDGTMFCNEESLAPVRNEQGRLTHFIGIIEDITERQRTEEALRRSEDLFRKSFEVASVGMALAAPDGRWLRVNPTLCRMLGYTEAEMLATNFQALTHPDDLGVCMTKIGQVLTGELPTCQLEKRYVHKDGRPIFIHASVALVRDERGKPVHFIAQILDITESREAQEQLLRAKEQADAANRAKSEFLANMSHEIRTPMNGIIGMTDLALTTNLTPEQRRYLEAVKSSGHDLLDIINDILDFSKIEAGKVELYAEDFSLRESMAAPLKALGLRADAKGLELTLHIPPSVPNRWRGDCGRLRQVLVNLIGNAIKFTDKGEVQLEISRESESMLRFCVRDTGIGIPLDKQSEIFKEFTQADSSITRRFGGTGLGLSISARLIELMGGHISVKSEEGRGSEFTFTIKLEPLPDAPARKREELAGRRVLIVDDNQTNREILLEMLRAWRVVAIAVAGAPAALEELERSARSGTPFDLVLLDAMMPGIDGFTLAERIKRKPDLNRTVLMMLSSAHASDHVQRCTGIGLQSYLVKPVAEAELMEAIGAALHAREPQPETATQEPRTAGRSLRILVAEDNPVNREVAAGLLSRLGHQVTLVTNGREAVETTGSGQFDAALLDVQMPEMDGLQAAQFIRQRERETGGHLHLVAVTAHALVGDRARCLEAGMDDYISKPLAQADVEAALQAVPGSSESFNRDAFVAQLGGDMELIARIAALFLSSTAGLVENLKKALERNSAEEASRYAHTLAGSLLQVGARSLAKQAAEIEQAGRASDLAKANRLVEPLCAGLNHLTPIFQQLTQSPVQT